MYLGTHRGQKMALDPLNLKLNVVVKSLTLVVEYQLWSL